MTQEQAPILYPDLSLRIRAIVIDYILVIVFITLLSFIFSLFDDVPDLLKIIFFAFIFFLYDPVFTSFLGGTIGHMINGIRVRQSEDETKNITFPLAIIRFITKVLFGWLSFVTVFSNNKKKAIHDMVSGSVIVYHV